MIIMDIVPLVPLVMKGLFTTLGAIVMTTALSSGIGAAGVGAGAGVGTPGTVVAFPITVAFEPPAMAEGCVGGWVVLS